MTCRKGCRYVRKTVTAAVQLSKPGAQGPCAGVEAHQKAKLSGTHVAVEHVEVELLAHDMRHAKGRAEDGVQRGECGEEEVAVGHNLGVRRSGRGVLGDAPVGAC